MDLDAVTNRIADLEDLLDALTDMSEGVSDDEMELVAQELSFLQSKLPSGDDGAAEAAESEPAAESGTAESDDATSILQTSDEPWIGGNDARSGAGPSESLRCSRLRSTLGCRELWVAIALVVLGVVLQLMPLSRTPALLSPATPSATNPTLGIPLEELPTVPATGDNAVPRIFDQVSHPYHCRPRRTLTGVGYSGGDAVGRARCVQQRGSILC